MRNKYRILKVFGITETQYDRLRAEQGNRCYICGKDGLRVKRGLNLDHNHDTGDIRKFLCPKCNMLVGMHEQDPYLLANICAYVFEHESSEIRENTK